MAEPGWADRVRSHHEQERIRIILEEAGMLAKLVAAVALGGIRAALGLRLEPPSEMARDSGIRY